MDSNNMTVWEVGVTACEQRILIIVFVSKDLACVMESGIECMQVGCFEWNGCLITIFPNYLHDSKINPQVMPIGSFTLPKVDENSEASSEEDDDIDTMENKSDSLDE